MTTWFKRSKLLILSGLQKYDCLWQSLLLIIRRKDYRQFDIENLSTIIVDKLSTLSTANDDYACDILTRIVVEQIVDSENWKSKREKMEKKSAVSSS